MEKTKPNIIVKQVIPVIDCKVRALCIKPYPNHPKGCPNFGKKEGCPPKAKKFEDVFDTTKPIYAIVNVFDLKSHADKMKEKHPNWSERQIYCCLYWQKTARKQLLEGIKEFLKEHKGYTVTTCPEAMGVEVTKTLEAVGIELEWEPKNIACQVALAGIKKQNCC